MAEAREAREFAEWELLRWLRSSDAAQRRTKWMTLASSRTVSSEAQPRCQGAGELRWGDARATNESYHAALVKNMFKWGGHGHTRDMRDL